AVNLSVSEDSAGNPSEFSKELPLATKHSVFSIAESREGFRPGHRNLAFQLLTFPCPWFLKHRHINDESSSRTSPHSWLAPSLRRFWRRFYESYALRFSRFGITARGFGCTGPGTSSGGEHSL